MPELRNINVRVTVDGTVDDQKIPARQLLPEWGVHKMRSSSKVSAYIEAQTGKIFQVLIQPKIPYPSNDAPAAHDYNTRYKALQREKGAETERPGFFKMEEEWEDEDGNRFSPYGRPDGSRDDIDMPENAKHRRSDSDLSHDSIKIKEKPSEEPRSYSSPIKPSGRMIRRTPPPPFHMLASLYIDGRSKPERRVIIYLDPDDEDYNYPSGDVEIKGRWAQCKNGSIKEQAWVFKDVGIETLFDKMMIAGDIGATYAHTKQEGREEEDALVDALDSTFLDGDADVKREEKSKVGQILVVIERVKLGEKFRDPNYQAKHKEDEPEDFDMGDAGRDITHTAGLAHKKTVRRHPIRVVAFTPYKEGEGSYAVFQFFYRSKDTLAKFNFIGFQPSTQNRQRQRITSRFMAFTTPLSIVSTSKSFASPGKRKVVTFDESVKEGGSATSKNTFSEDREEGRRFKKEKSESPHDQESELGPIPLPAPNDLQTSISFRKTPMSQLAEGSEFHRNKSGKRYNLRILTEKTINIPGSIPPGIGRSINLDLATPTIVITPSSDSDEAMLGKAKRGRPSTPYTARFPDNAFRVNGSNASDADDEHETSELGERVESDVDCDDGGPSRNEDDQGLSVGVKELVLGKRGRNDEERRGQENRSGTGTEVEGSEEGEIVLRARTGRRGALTPMEAQEIMAWQGKKRAKME